MGQRGDMDKGPWSSGAQSSRKVLPFAVLLRPAPLWSPSSLLLLLFPLPLPPPLLLPPPAFRRLRHQLLLQQGRVSSL